MQSITEPEAEAERRRMLMSELRAMMDEELYSAIERAMRHWTWTQPQGVTQNDLDQVFPLEEFRLKLRQALDLALAS